MTPLRTTPMPAGQADRADPPAAMTAIRPAPISFDPGSRLTAEEYAAWLLPPRPRDGLEKVVHALSLGAGMVAAMGGLGALWWML